MSQTSTRYLLPVIALLLALTGCGGGSGIVSPEPAGSPLGLVISGGALTPSFTPTTTDYAVSVGLFQPSMSVTPSAPAGTAIQVNGQPTPSDAPTTIVLPVGSTPIAVTMTTQDGVTTNYSVIVTRAATASEEAILKARTPDAEDGLGSTVAIHGDTLVVGAFAEDSDGSGEANNDASRAGAAYVFVRVGGLWSQQAYLKAPSPNTSDLFGHSVAIHGDTIVVGATADDGPGDSLSNSGAVYVFVRDGVNWIQQAYLQASNAEVSDGFGGTVAIQGDTLVVGAASEDSDGSGATNNDASNSGAAYVFVRTGTTWAEQDYLKSQTPGIDDRFGQRVALHDETIVVGAFAESIDLPGAGGTYVFVRGGSSWTQQAHLQASNLGAGDAFGISVAVHGDTVAVGAFREDSDGNSETNDDESDSGAVYVFVRAGTTWTQQAYLKTAAPGSLDWFGVNVALDGDALAIGAQQEDSDGSSEANGDTPESGAAYVFVREGTTWTQQAFLKASNPSTSAFYGSALALDAGVLAIGAYWESSQAPASGAVYIVR